MPYKRQGRFTTGIGDVSTVERMVISDARFAASGFKKALCRSFTERDVK